MREFFFTLLNNLYKMAGLRQLEKIYEEFPDKKDHTREINALLDELCKVCGMFSYIPELDMQNIIRDKIYSDPKFIGLNGKILFNWFDSVKGPYYSRYVDEQAKKSEGEKVNAEPLTGEARDKAIEKWQQALNKVGHPEKVEHTGSKLKSKFSQLSDVPEIKERYRPPSLEEIEKRERHTAWIRANFDAYTGKPLPGFIEEKEWLKTNYGNK